MKHKVFLCLIIAGLFLTGCGKKYDLYIYNWGQYIDEDVLKIFEKETGLSVSYEEFETNEAMYPKVANGAGDYDVICPSDYMIQKMIEEDLLAPINYDNIPNIKYIGKKYMEQSEAFDPGNLYSVPYCWGTVGIIYNKKMVKEPVDSWSILWDEKYYDNVLMQNSVRDAFGITLKWLGYSLNSTDPKELKEARDKLIEEKKKGLVQAYVVDQVRDKMLDNSAALGVIYSGEASYTISENPDLAYAVPKEGTNSWIDSWVIPKNSKHKKAAEQFINFLCRPDIALKNFEYICYSTPNIAVRDMLEDEALKNDEILFPSEDVLKNTETYQYLGEEMDQKYYELWKEVKGS
ncbi:spermidine/putrescine transport system substrate-binding protein [[Clostridium] polysaccharolyticum]|uniref:Spermidine/putrescine transport system substrate-binding protein n=1 Tax=[Clostridium] polysaccharolyticum TaxID=29364 RepID=A0A1H9YNT6_9FIRM|nr:ABC transporter substrate-binding protein [[Clostridium] polysaccharolyticum]SES70684.1 spermidine/putrescine transport system substrate-binding protein [[Clostridium] polysaccharolyticum]